METVLWSGGGWVGGRGGVLVADRGVDFCRPAGKGEERGGGVWGKRVVFSPRMRGGGEWVSGI